MLILIIIIKRIVNKPMCNPPLSQNVSFVPHARVHLLHSLYVFQSQCGVIFHEEGPILDVLLFRLVDDVFLEPMSWSFRVARAKELSTWNTETSDEHVPYVLRHVDYLITISESERTSLNVFHCSGVMHSFEVYVSTVQSSLHAFWRRDWKSHGFIEKRENVLLDCCSAYTCDEDISPRSISQSLYEFIDTDMSLSRADRSHPNVERSISL